LVRHALVEVLTREENPDPDLDGRSVTVTEVRVSPDLRVATCFVTPLGGGEEHVLIKRLAAVGPWLSSQVAKRVRLKFAPRLRFVADKSFDQAQSLDELLQRDDIARDLRGRETSSGEHSDGA
jgi:ribosome-binding factor A